MTPSIIVREPLAVVGMKIITRPMSAEIPQLWPRFVARIGEIDAVLEPRVSYGVMEPAGQAPDVLDNLAYLAAVSVPDTSARVPEGMCLAVIPGGQYAVFEFALSEVGAAFGYIFNTWLPASGLVHAGTATFERYGEHFDPADPASMMQACIPVRPAG
ncbi:MAG: hypothetical protein RIQ60_611 [Pseudomonadota bacterium]